ncbi:ArsR/SmtB family transcription factor [Aneurinibacillus sp. REN35]|uniref:ArsR/SmtB family transcription factor n=1 Tax=Aneurinibacillus sp. REN35 TaxID=3237286 RepID=UPI0035290CF7
MKQEDCCEIFCYDEEKVQRIQGMLSDIESAPVAQLFKALSDDTRLRIVYALCQEPELCVCDVANIIGSTMAAASHHLRLLRAMGLARHRKEGKLVFYSLHDEQIRQLVGLVFLQRGEVTPS